MHPISLRCEILLQSTSLFACWFQPGFISHGTIFSSHNKPAPAGLISPKTNQRTGWLDSKCNVWWTGYLIINRFKWTWSCKISKTLTKLQFNWFHKQYVIIVRVRLGWDKLFPTNLYRQLSKMALNLSFLKLNLIVQTTTPSTSMATYIIAPTAI